MSRRTPAWLSFTLVVVLLLQAALPAFAPPVAFAAAAAPPSATVTPEPAPPAFAAAAVPVTTTVAFTPTLPSPPTAAPAPAAAAGNLNLDLSLDPPWAAPGDVVTCTVTARNPDAARLPTLTLTATLPDGLVYVAHSAQGFDYDAQTQRLTWLAGDLAPSAVITGSFQARMLGLALGEIVTNTVIATSPALAALGQATAALEVVAPRNNETWATPETGGQLRSADDRLLLRIPPGAAPGRTSFRYAPAGNLPQPLAGLRYAFTVDAQADAGQAVHTFAAPLDLILAYQSAEFPAGHAAPALYYFDAAAGRWTALPTAVDRARRQLRVRVPHLTLFAAAASGGFVPEVMPSIRGVQSDLFTGSVGVAYPITLPPGRGGLTPDFTLQFNSQSRQADAGNASVVGTGWKSSADSFVYATPFNPGSPPPTWRLAGAAFSEAGNGSTGWYFREAPQWRVAKPAGGALDAYAPNGTRYHFEPALHDWYNQGVSVRTDKWVLQYVRDPQGNQIDYVYDSALPVNPTDVRNNPNNYADALGPRYRYFDDGNFGVYYLTQINLLQIRYNGGQTVVDLTYSARADAPAPFCTQYNSLSAPGDYVAYWGQFTTRLLTGIRVRQGGQLVAGYKLTYDQWGNAATCANWARYALQGVARCSNESLTNCLPATSFTNAPQEDNQNGVLTRYANGYGGQVTFGYGADGVLATRTVTDTVTGTTNQWSYSYTDKLYDGWNVVGYAQVTETLPASLGPGNTIYHHFINGTGADAGFRGKEDQQLVTVASVKQQEVTRVWAGTTAGVNGGGKLVYLSEETQKTYDKAGLNPLARKTAYFYDLDYQGGAQHGNATRIAEYADAADGTPYRTTLNRYCPNTTAWIVDRPAASNVYTGSVPAPPAPPDPSQLAASTWYIYSDDQVNPAPSWNQPVGSKGQLRGVRRYQGPDAGGNPKYVDVRYRHDVYGNVTEEQTFNNYGAANAWADTVANTVTTGYDTTYAVYPTSVMVMPAASLGGATLTTNYTYYGVNPDSGGVGLTGQLQKVSDPNGAETRYSYDGFGRALELRQPGAAFGNPATEKLAYTDAAPYAVKHSLRDDANGDTSSAATYLDDWTYYDGLGQVLQTQADVENSSQSAVVSRLYDALGAVIGATAPYTGTTPGTYQPFNWTTPPQPTTRTVYDSLGRVTKVTQPDGSTVESVYHGRKTAVLNPLGRQTLSQVDAFGRLVSSQQYSGSYTKNPPAPGWNDAAYATATYAYNVRDQLEQVVGPDGAVTDPTYNLLGQKTQLLDPDMGTWTYAYDALGNLARQTDARGCVITFSYDGHNRLLGKTYSGTCSSQTALSYGYDDTTLTYTEGATTVPNRGKGRRTQMTDGSGATQWVYDGRGRLRKQIQTVTGTGGGAFVTQWGYDSAARPRWQTYPGGNASQSGEQVNFAYTAQGLLDTVSGTAPYVGDTQYNVRAQVTERHLASQAGVVRQLYAYTAAENFRQVRLQAGNVSPYTNLQNLGYTYDDNGNVLTITDAGAYGGSQTQTFGYGDLDRLSTAQASGTTTYGGYAQRSYGYSNAGNVTGFETAAFTYLDAAHKHALTHIGGVQKYWYDPNGNATRRIAGSQDITLNYDAENRLTAMSGGATASYVYDGDDNRVKATAGSTTTVYIGNYFEWTGSTATMKSYYYAGTTRIALRTGTSTGTLNYLLGDHLGSQALTLTSAGARLATNTELRYYPYGVARYTAGTTPTSYNFTGQRKDSGSGLLFYNARWYDPQVGRFLQSDTLVPEVGNPQALNRYSYTLNNPLKYNDPTGHWVETAWDVLNVGWDIAEVKRDPSFLNVGALVVDVAAVLVPAVPAGVGLIARAGKAGKAAVEVASHADEAADAVRLAGHMGDGVHAVLTASMLRQAGAHSDESARLVKALAEQSTRNGRIQNGMTILGSYDEYINMAKLEGLTYFNMPTEAWDILKTDKALTWEVNRQFLDDSIAAGHSFVVTLGEGKPIGTYLQQEIDYLVGKGYKLVDGILVKP